MEPVQVNPLVGPPTAGVTAAKGGRIDGWLTRGASSSEVVEELYLAAFSRVPTQQESTELVKLLSQSADRKDVLRDLMWAVISSREFAENH